MEADTSDTACGRLTPSELRRTELMQTIDALPAAATAATL